MLKLENRLQFNVYYIIINLSTIYNILNKKYYFKIKNCINYIKKKQKI